MSDRALSVEIMRVKHGFDRRVAKKAVGATARRPTGRLRTLPDFAIKGKGFKRQPRSRGNRAKDLEANLYFYHRKRAGRNRTSPPVI
jgi:hypothetical protein